MAEDEGGIDRRSFLMLTGVLTKIMLKPFCSSWRDKARKGIMWPWPMNGNNTMVSFLISAMNSISFLFSFGFFRESARELWNRGRKVTLMEY